MNVEAKESVECIQRLIRDFLWARMLLLATGLLYLALTNARHRAPDGGGSTARATRWEAVLQRLRMEP